MRGRPEFSTVLVKLIDAHTIEERDKSDGKVAKITRWVVTPDGKTVHARSSSTHSENPGAGRTQVAVARDPELEQKFSLRTVS